MAVDEMIRKQYKAADLKISGERQILGRISTTAVDREGDVMLPSGIEYKSFMANPVVMYEHAAWATDPREKLPVGTVPRGGIRKDSGGVTALVDVAKRPDSLPPEQEWWPDTVLDLFDQKVLRAFSVGFIINDARQATDKDISRFGEKARRVITDWSLLEFSVCAIPVNQEALALAVSKGVRRDSWAVPHVDAKQLVLPSPLDMTLPSLQLDAMLCVDQ